MAEKGVLFFATKNDLHHNLKEFEQNISIAYIKYGNHESEKAHSFYTIDDLPDLGKNPSYDHNCGGYLVQTRDAGVLTREIVRPTGEIIYYVDQIQNASSLIFWPGGYWGDDCLIHGQAKVMHGNDEAKKLYSHFSKYLIKGYKKYRSYYIGPEALALAGKCRYITISAKESKDYDLNVV